MRPASGEAGEGKCPIVTNKMQRFVSWFSPSASEAKRARVLAEMAGGAAAGAVFEGVHANEDFVLTMTVRLRKYVCAVRFDMVKGLCIVMEFGKTGALLERVRPTREMDDAGRALVATYLNATTRCGSRGGRDVMYVPALGGLVIAVEGGHVADVHLIPATALNWDVLLDGTYMFRAQASSTVLYVVAKTVQALLE